MALTLGNIFGFNLPDIHPVGSIVLRLDAIEPATLYGGTWELLTGDATLSLGDGTTQAGTPVGTNSVDVPLLAHTHIGPSHTHTGPSHTHSNPAHGHTAVTSSGQSAGHTHTGPSHTHSTPAHTHTASFAGTPLSNHFHGNGFINFPSDNITTQLGSNPIGGSNYAVARSSSSRTGNVAPRTAPESAGTPSGSVTVASGGGSTTGSASGTTGTQSADHTHSVTVTEGGATTSGAGGTGATGAGGDSATSSTGVASPKINVKGATLPVNVWLRTA